MDMKKKCSCDVISAFELGNSGGLVITDFSYFFYGGARKEMLQGLDTSSGTKFDYMFTNVTWITPETEIALDTSNGESFVGMFQGANIVTAPMLNTIKGTKFNNMFCACQSLTSVPDLDTSNGTNFSSMFSNCTNLVTAPKLDTSKGTDFQYMFQSCSNLKSIPYMDIGSLTDKLYCTFNYCDKLETLMLYNIRTKFLNLSTNPALSADSLTHIIKELCRTQDVTKDLTLTSTQYSTVANTFCVVTDENTEKIDMELCSSSTQNAITLVQYASKKGWKVVSG